MELGAAVDMMAALLGHRGGGGTALGLEGGCRAQGMTFIGSSILGSRTQGGSSGGGCIPRDAGEMLGTTPPR